MDERKTFSGDEIMICPKCGNDIKFMRSNVTNSRTPMKNVVKCSVCGHVFTEENDEETL